MTILAGLFGVLFFVCAVMSVVSLFKTGKVISLGKSSKAKAFFSWLGIGLACVVMGGIVAPSQTETEPKATATAKPLQYTVLEKKEEVRAAIKRNRLHVVIIPAVPQDTIPQAELADMVMQAAKALQKESGAPVVSVKMVCQKASNDFGQLMLASAVYIPDRKGYSGSQDLGPWDNLMAAPRGFTGQELEYLRLWADMRGSFQKDDRTDDAALDKAISERMGIAPGSLKPHENTVQRMEVK